MKDTSILNSIVAMSNEIMMKLQNENIIEDY